MTTLASLLVALGIDTKDYDKGLDAAANKTKGLGGVLASVAGGVATAGLATLAVGAAGLGAGLKVAMDEAMEAQGNIAQLDAVLKSTGGSAGVTRDLALDLADSLQDVTRFSDDTVLQAENLLLTFTNIGQYAFEEAVPILADMSTALGQDMVTSAMQLGKALNDPVKGVTALRRVGVQLTKEQEDQVKAFMASGDAARAQGIILQELQKEFGGSAKAAGQTLAGQMDIMKNSLLDVAETAGTALMPAFTEAIAQIKPIIVDLANSFAEFVKSDQFKQWVEAVVNWLKNDLPAGIQSASNFWNTQLKPAIENSKPIFEKLWPMLSKIGEILGTILPPAIGLFVGAWSVAFDLIKLAAIPIENIWKAFKTLWEWIGKVKDGLTNLALPSWLTPGSPTPLELGILGINDALSSMTSSGLPSINAGFGRMPALAGGGAGAGGLTVVYSPGMSLGNQAEFESQFIPMLQRALRKVNRGSV